MLLAGCSAGDGAPASTASTTTSSSTTTTTATTTSTPMTTVPLVRGTFTVAPGGSAVAGLGPLRRYIVEVEDATAADPVGFAAEVDRILADPHGWTARGTVGFQRVDAGPVDFRVVLATSPTTDMLCAPLETNSRYSCFQDGRSVINLDRWTLGAEAESGLPLDRYREYVISHEVGHALGHGHVGCPGAGQPAPVMMQQTKGIGACAPNPWPYPAG